VLADQRKEYHYESLTKKEEVQTLRQQLEKLRQEWDRATLEQARRHHSDLEDANERMEACKGQHAAVILDVCGCLLCQSFFFFYVLKYFFFFFFFFF
jgi:hypothetical protein